MEVGLSLNAGVQLPFSSSRTHEDGLVRHSLVSTKTTTQKAAEQKQGSRTLVVESKSKRGMMARQFQPKKPPPPAMPKIEDDGNPRFVVFMRMANVYLWYPLSVISGGTTAKIMIAAKDNFLGKYIYKDTLARNLAAVIYRMELLLEGHGIMGFVDGINLCPSRFDSTVSGGSTDSSLRVETDAFKIWKMHDRALMQLITATLSPSAVSCAIGSTSARDLWVRLKEQFSIVTRTTIFQMKSALQNIKKGTDSISQYLQRIKEARDYLSAAGVTFADDDIVILTLNGLSSEYNTLRSIIRGREHVISMKDLRSQLLAEEAMIENVAATPFLTAMVAKNSGHDSQNSSYDRQSNPYGSQSGFFNASGYKPNFHKNKGRGKFYNNSYPRFGNTKSGYINNAPGILGNSPPSKQGQFHTNCQICGKYGHLADTCRFRNSDTAAVQGCQICGKKNHSAQFCLYRNSNVQNSVPTAMHVNTVSNSVVPSASPQQFWLTDSGATSHMTADLNNLSLATPYPSTETIQTASGAGQGHREDNVQGALQ